VATLLSIGLKFLPLRDLVVPLKTINDVKNYFHNVSGTIRLGEITMLEWRNGNRRTVGVFTGILHRRATTLDKLRLMCARNFFYPATCVADLLPNGSTIGSNRLRAQGFAVQSTKEAKVRSWKTGALSFFSSFFLLSSFLSFFRRDCSCFQFACALNFGTETAEFAAYFRIFEMAGGVSVELIKW